MSVTFDNLGEAAEQELGLPTPTGGHYSVTNALPIVLGELADAHTPATFFVEGVNANTYPQALRSILDAGHECAFHAWRHEDWRGLGETAERANLARGIAAMRACGAGPAGFRPPGGVLGERTLQLLESEGLSYCSPAGAGFESGAVVVLPFAWRSVDAYHLLEPFAALREHFDGSRDPGGPRQVGEALIGAVDAAVRGGGHAMLVLHTWLVEAEREAVRAVLERVREGARRGELWSARCDEVASWVRAHTHAFADRARLDTTSWMNPG